MNEPSKEKIDALTAMSKRMRQEAIDMAWASGKNGAHLGGSLSCIEILAVLYGDILRIRPQEPEWPQRDVFLPSKNHCVLAHFPALSEAGFLSKTELNEFQKEGGRLTGYPRNLEIGLEYSGGSLGMAISVGVGMALARRERKSDSYVYVLMGDGELNEGSIWEAFMSAAQYQLSHLVAIIDRNHLSYDGDTEDVMGIENLEGKMQNFGWCVSHCNGHHIEELLQAFTEIKKETSGIAQKENEKSVHDSALWGKPHILIAETIKGKGVSFMENKREWHHGRLTKEQYELAKREVEG